MWFGSYISSKIIDAEKNGLHLLALEKRIRPEEELRVDERDI